MFTVCLKTAWRYWASGDRYGGECGSPDCFIRRNIPETVGRRRERGKNKRQHDE